MSRRPVRVLTALLSAAALASTLSACGTGLQAQTYKNLGRTDGTRADVGGINGIAVRDLHVAPPTTGITIPQGDAALVTGGLVNKSAVDDTLVSVSSPVASSVVLTVAGKPVDSVPIPGNDAAPLTWGAQLTGITRPLTVDDYIVVTLSFEHAGRVTLSVPVWAGDNGLGQRTPLQNPYGEK